MALPNAQNSGIGKDVAVYVGLLVLAGIQFVIAYQDISTSQMFVRMLTVAIVEAGLALLFFMHLSENRGLRWFVVDFHGCRNPRNAIWMDRQLPPVRWRALG